MWWELQIFGFRALWSPYFLTFILILAVLYYLFTGPLRKVFGDVVKPTINQQAFMYSGLVLLYIIKGSPIDLLSHIMLSAHMMQMGLLYLVLPIFIIRGVPAWMLERFIALPVIKPIFTFFTHPIIALAVFSSLFPMYHIPLIFDFSKASPVAHVSITLILFVTAFFMWWPVVTPLKEHEKLKPLLKMAYLLGNVFLVSIACALIIFASKPIYQAYSSSGAWLQSMALCVPGNVLDGLAGTLSSAEMFSPLSAKDDQQLGGIIMMVIQQGVFGFVHAWIFFNWFSKKNMGIDPLPAHIEEWK